MKKVRYGRVWVYPNSQMLGSGMSGIGKVGFGWQMKFQVSDIFEYRYKTFLNFTICDWSGMEKFSFGLVRD